MNIAENILKHNLQNVYFLTGTALAGKTTMSNALCAKYGFVHFNDNYHEERFGVWRSIINEKHQPFSTRKKETTDWEAFFGRPLEDYLAEREKPGEYEEYVEFMLMELIKLSQHQKVVADILIPAKLLTEIAGRSHTACLLAAPELLNCRNYGAREDHRDFLECPLSLKEPEKKIAVQDELFRITGEKIKAEAEEYGLFTLVRSDSSTVENTLAQLEKHFGL